MGFLKMKNIISILQNILKEKDTLNKEKLIEDFQNKIWIDNIIIESDPNYVIFSELAYDLEFYEPNPELRKGELSNYGDERLEKEIKNAIEKIEKFSKS